MSLVVVSLLFAAILAELILRFVAPVSYLAPPSNRSDEPWRGLLHRRSDIPGLDYELAPNQKMMTRHGMVETNSFGMRDTEPLTGDDVFRVVRNW